MQEHRLDASLLIRKTPVVPGGQVRCESVVRPSGDKG